MTLEEKVDIVLWSKVGQACLYSITERIGFPNLVVPLL